MVGEINNNMEIVLESQKSSLKENSLKSERRPLKEIELESISMRTRSRSEIPGLNESRREIPGINVGNPPIDCNESIQSADAPYDADDEDMSNDTDADENKENVPPNVPVNLPSEEELFPALSDERGVGAPVAKCSVSLSQILEIECTAVAKGLHEVDTYARIGEIDKETSIKISHKLFDRIWAVSSNISSAVKMVGDMISLKTQIYLGEDVYITIKSKYPVTPVDIRRFEVGADGKLKATREGQCMTPNEWRVFSLLLPDIHEGFLGIERQVRKIQGLLKKDLEQVQEQQGR